jgi:hypothetical protein
MRDEKGWLNHPQTLASYGILDTLRKAVDDNADVATRNADLILNASNGKNNVFSEATDETLNAGVIPSRGPASDTTSTDNGPWC